MARTFEDLYRLLRKGFFLSSMLGYTDGAFCADRSAGCAMVQLGAYLAEPPAYGTISSPYARAFLPADPAACTAFLAQECRRARGRAPVRTCMNLATPRLDWGLEAARCFAQAGGDLVELNVHGAYSRYLRLGKLRAMVLPENQPELLAWVEAFAGLDLPLIVKLYGRSNRRQLLQVLERIARYDLFGVHINVRNEKARKPDLALVRQVRQQYPGFLLVSGYVRSAADARDLFAAGADMVGIAEPAIRDAGYIAGIVGLLRQPPGG